MPLSAKSGDFASSTVEGCIFESYIFSVPGEKRSNIASLVIVFKNLSYDREEIRKFFSFTITELQTNNFADIQTLAKILPNLYKGLCQKHIKIKISSIVTLEFDFDDKEKIKGDREEELVDSIKSDFWR